MVTEPWTPSTSRTRTDGIPARGGMKSVTRTVPVRVRHCVDRISVSPR